MLNILRLILIILVIRAVLMLVRGVIDGKRGAGDRTVPPSRSVQLVRDPVCGVYVNPSSALTVRSGVGTAYFCSERCRQAWPQS